MRRVVFLCMGILECAVAVVLISLGYHIPSPDEVAHGFGSADRVTRRAADQVEILRKQIEELRRPEFMQLAERLESQTKIVAGNIESRPIDFQLVETMRDALAEIATTLETIATRAETGDKDMTLPSDLRTTLFRSAGLLRTSSQQLGKALEHRDGYEETMRQSVALAKLVAGTLPFLTEQLDSRLAEEQHALGELRGSLEDVQACIPVYAKTTAQVLQSGRLLAWLGASLAAVHGGYLLMSTRLGRRYSG